MNLPPIDGGGGGGGAEGAGGAGGPSPAGDGESHAPRHQGFGHAPAIGPTTRLECKICWAVYDPAEGDPVWQVPPGTAFTALPAHWSCPQCSATRDQFLVLLDAE